MIHRVGILIVALLTSAGSAMASTYCALAPGRPAGELTSWRYGDGIVSLTLTGRSGGGLLASFYVGLEEGRPELYIGDYNTSAQQVGDHTVRFEFTDNRGNKGLAEARTQKDGATEFVLSPANPQAGSAARFGYGRYRVSEEACVEAQDAYQREFADDKWRYLKANAEGAAVAEFISWNSLQLPYAIFRVTCDAPKHRLQFEYHIGKEEGPAGWSDYERKQPLIISFYAPSTPVNDFAPTMVISLPHTLTEDGLTAGMVVTPEMAAMMGAASTMDLDATNGPGNTWGSGKARAFKRLARECSE